MSVYDELNDCIESAWSSDSCEYEVCSEMFDLIAEAEYKYDNLKAENAKLRDLIADMSKAFFTLDIDHCQACPRDKASRCQMFATTDWECAFVTEMRKLGIEATK